MKLSRIAAMGLVKTAFAEDGKTYVSTSYGIYNVLNKIFAIYGTPDKWEKGIGVEVAKRPVGNGKEMLTLKLI